MIQHVWTVLCSKALEDKHSHNVSLIETIVSLGLTVPPDAPADLPIIVDYTLANLWYNDGNTKEAATIRTSLVQPSGKESGSAETSMEVTPNKFHKVFTRVKNINLKGPGMYQFIIRIRADGESRWKRVATIPLKVNYTVDEEAALIHVPAEADL